GRHTRRKSTRRGLAGMDSNRLGAYTRSQMMLSHSNLCRVLCAATASLALTLASSMAAPVLAADLGVAPIYRPVAPVANWTGSYIGISGGGAWGNSVVHNDLTGVDQTP